MNDEVKFERLLVSDIDGTLLQEGEPTAGLYSLEKLLQSHEEVVGLLYATGRTMDSVRTLMEHETLPVPVAVAALVGTEIWFAPWTEPDRGYAAWIRQGWSSDDVERLARQVPGLEPQPAKYVTDVKKSYFVEGPDAVREINEKLRSAGLAFRSIHSSDRFLDVIPSRAGKKAAVEYIMGKMGLDDVRVLAAGDSLNDLDMLDDPSYMSVVVGNSDDGLGDRLQGPNVHESDLPHAAGVLEGAEAFEFWEEPEEPES